MAGSLDSAKLYFPPQHTRPANTAAGRLASIAEGVFVERADRLLTDAVLNGLAERFRGRPADAETVYDVLVALLATLFPDHFQDADRDEPDLTPAPHTDVDRRAALDGSTERERRAAVAREHGRAEPAGLVPTGRPVPRVSAKHLAALAARLKRRED